MSEDLHKLYLHDDDPEVDEILQRLWKYAKKHGYTIPDRKWTHSQLHVMKKNGGVCPCRAERGKCPCKEGATELQKEGRCICGVFFNLN